MIAGTLHLADPDRDGSPAESMQVWRSGSVRPPTQLDGYVETIAVDSVIACSPARRTPMNDPILICYDGSEPAKRAIGVAAEILGPRSVVVLDVAPLFTPAESYAVAASAASAVEFEHAHDVEGLADLGGHPRGRRRARCECDRDRLSRSDGRP